MADSADDLLARARQARQEWLESACIQDGCLEEADAAYAVLDTWLSSGGPLPTAWAGCAPAQPVTDVPLTDQISIKVIEDDRMPPGAAAMIGADGQIVAITGLGDPGGPDIAADVREAQHRIEAGEIADTWAFDEPESERAALISGLAAALRSLADKDAKISRLTAELDAARNVPVEYVITSGLEAAMAADPHREDGSVLRETDGAKRAYEWKAAANAWEQIR